MSVKSNLPFFAQAQLLMASQIQHLDLKTKSIIHRIEIKIKPVDLISWLEAQVAKVKIYGANQDNSAAIAGIGEALTLAASKGQDFALVFKQLRQYLTPQYPYMQWYGGFCFDEQRVGQDWTEFGAYRFVLPRFELASNGDKMIFCCNLIGLINESKRKQVLKELGAIAIKTEKPVTAFKAQQRRDLPSPSQWARNVDGVLAGIKRGEFKKIVLARKTRLSFAKPLNAFAIFRQLQQVTPNSYHFCFQFGKTTFLGASPERL